MNKILHPFQYVLLFLLVHGNTFAQQDVYITNITREAGINNKRVNSITQDSAGIIWFGIFGEGLATYNGKKIRRVHLENEDRFANRRMMFCADSKLLYLNSRIGLEIFDPIQEEIIDTIPHEDPQSKNFGFDKIEFTSYQSDTLIWALKNETRTAEMNFYSRLESSKFSVYLSKNKSPFRKIGREYLECMGLPILIPYEDKVLLKSSDNFRSLDQVGRIQKHSIPDIDIRNIYDGNIVIDKESNLWIANKIRCTPKPLHEITVKNHYEYVSKGQFMKYSLNEDVHESYPFEVDSKHFISTQHLPFVFQLIELDGKLIYDLKYSFSLQTKRVNPLKQIFEGAPFMSALSSIESFLIDRTGVLWVAGDFGLIKVLKPETGFELLPNLGERSFLEDKSGKVHGNIVGKLFKTKESPGGTLSTYDPETGDVEYTKVQILINGEWKLPYVHWIKTAIHSDKFYARNLIIDSQNAIATRYPNGSNINLGGGEANILIDSKKRLWRFAWDFELIGIYDLETTDIIRVDTLPDFVEFPVQLNDCYERPTTGNIWIATNGKGIYVMPSDKGEIIHLSKNENSPLLLLDNVVSGLYENAASNMWVGHGLGLSKISKDLEEITHFPFDPSMNERRLIYSILPDDNDNFLWLSTDKGIYRYDIKGNEYLGFPLDQIVMAAEYNRTSFLKTSRGQVFYGGIIDGDRTVAFYPDEVIKKYEEEAQKECPIIVSNLDIYDTDIKGIKSTTERLNALENITLNPGDRFFELEFEPADYRSTHTNYYAYYLDGYDDQQMIPAKGENKVRYENLAPGSYTLILKAGFNAIAARNNLRKIKVVVLPFWYETLWAKFVGIFLVICMLYYFYQYSLNKKLKRQEEKRDKELDELKSRLYTNITHEFRTPLTVILGMNDNIHGNDQEKSLIKRNAKNLLQLINQLLNLSKLDSGKLDVNDKKGDFIGYIQYLTESFYSMASERKIDIKFSANTKSFLIDYDETKVQHIVFNLISNAIKFTRPGGKVAIKVEVPLDSNPSFYSIVIKDTGIGIDEKHLPHIFERFYQISENQNSTFQGTGIGLAFVKELVELMNGKITVKSKKSWGTEFEILMPLKENDQVQTTNQIQPVHSSNELEDTNDSLPINPDQIEGDKPIILVIEDNAGVITYIKSILNITYHVEIAINGLEGLERAKEIIPDIILTDVMMPEKNGFEVVKDLKNSLNTSHIPIIMLTAKADLTSKIMGFEFGADAYLSKPFEKDELLARIKNLLLVRQKLQAFYSGSTPKMPVELNTSPRDQVFMDNLISLIEDKVFEADFSAAEIPRMVLMSNTQFYRKLKALTGQAPTVFIRRIRFEKAIQLLSTTDLSIAEIAYKVGFSDPNYFTRIFKKEMGRLPGSFR